MFRSDRRSKGFHNWIACPHPKHLYGGLPNNTRYPYPLACVCTTLYCIYQCVRVLSVCIHTFRLTLSMLGQQRFREIRPFHISLHSIAYKPAQATRGTRYSYLVRCRTPMAFYTNPAINLSATWLNRDYLFTLCGFSHFQHLLPGQVASCLKRACLKSRCFMATVRVSPPCHSFILALCHFLSTSLYQGLSWGRIRVCPRSSVSLYWVLLLTLFFGGLG